MGYHESGKAALDADFNSRIQACVFKVAQDVLAEDPTTPGHALRAGLAKDIIFNPGGHTNPFAWLCASSPTVASTITIPAAANSPVVVTAIDSALEAVVTQGWNAVAGWTG